MPEGMVSRFDDYMKNRRYLAALRSFEDPELTDIPNLDRVLTTHEFEGKPFSHEPYSERSGWPIWFVSIICR